MAAPQDDVHRIVVDPDQIYPKQVYGYTRATFYRVIGRYILFSGVVVAVVTALGVASLAFFRW